MLERKKGSSFSVTCIVTHDNGSVFSLDGYDISCAIVGHSGSMNLLVGQGIEVVDSSAGHHRLDVVLGDLPTGAYQFDVKYKNGQDVQFSDIQEFAVIGTITQ